MDAGAWCQTTGGQYQEIASDPLFFPFLLYTGEFEANCPVPSLNKPRCAHLLPKEQAWEQAIIDSPGPGRNPEEMLGRFNGHFAFITFGQQNFYYFYICCFNDHSC